MSEEMMFEQQAAYRMYVRRAFEKRLGRTLSDMEFERLLRIGHGVFWDYDPYGHIHPYDSDTLRSNAQRWTARQPGRPAEAATTG